MSLSRDTKRETQILSSSTQTTFIDLRAEKWLWKNEKGIFHHKINQNEKRTLPSNQMDTFSHTVKLRVCLKPNSEQWANLLHLKQNLAHWAWFLSKKSLLAFLSNMWKQNCYILLSRQSLSCCYAKYTQVCLSEQWDRERHTSPLCTTEYSHVLPFRRF